MRVAGVNIDWVGPEGGRFKKRFSGWEEGGSNVCGACLWWHVVLWLSCQFCGVGVAVFCGAISAAIVDGYSWGGKVKFVAVCTKGTVERDETRWV